ncbi:MAG: CHAD domain-containing protein [Actinomycetota bacterium]|nr:CHAD domain-containing protein [Actinomycetota bacterium]
MAALRQCATSTSSPSVCAAGRARPRRSSSRRWVSDAVLSSRTSSTHWAARATGGCAARSTRPSSPRLCAQGPRCRDVRPGIGSPGWSSGDGCASRDLSGGGSRPATKRHCTGCASMRDADATGDEAALHRVRIDARRGRYVCDATAPVLGPAVATMARRLAALQDVLGEAHDALVAAAWAEEVGVVAGEPVGKEILTIVDTERAAATAALDRWPGVWRRAAAVAAGEPWRRG